MADREAASTPETTRVALPHHVVLKNGRDDVVCACGKHFRGLDALARDAIQQWVTHYRETEGQPSAATRLAVVEGMAERASRKGYELDPDEILEVITPSAIEGGA